MPDFIKKQFFVDKSIFLANYISNGALVQVSIPYIKFQILSFLDEK